MRLYGLGSGRGVAVHAPGTTPDMDTPLPLWRQRREVQAIIDEQNAKHGTGSLYVISYEVRS